MSIYSVFPEHGSSEHELHRPARDLSRLNTLARKKFERKQLCSQVNLLRMHFNNSVMFKQRDVVMEQCIARLNVAMFNVFFFVSQLIRYQLIPTLIPFVTQEFC
ncbi:hypothetical protein YC2023_120598 [Brassica napus]